MADDEKQDELSKKEYRREARKSLHAGYDVVRKEGRAARQSQPDGERRINDAERQYILDQVNATSEAFTISNTQKAYNEAFAAGLLDRMNVPVLDDARASRNPRLPRFHITLDDAQLQEDYLVRGTMRRKDLTNAERREHLIANSKAAEAARAVLASAVQDDCYIDEKETAKAVEETLLKLTAAGTDIDAMKRAINLVQHIAGTTNLELAATRIDELYDAAKSEIDAKFSKESGPRQRK